MTHSLSADDVIERLDINKATLYSYVSRGLIRSEEGGGKTRNRRYWAEDVEALARRKEQRRNPSLAAEDALKWGEPVLESAITLIHEGQLYYRGQDALTLATTQHFEQVAALLWTGDAADAYHFVRHRPTSLSFQMDPALRPIDRFQSILPLAAQQDLAAYTLTPTAFVQTGVRIVHLLALLSGAEAGEGRLAERLQWAWQPTAPATAALIDTRLIDAALILCADHELNVSTFTARCVASAGSTLYAVVAAGLAALQGIHHGGHTERVEALLREAKQGGVEVVVERIKRGEAIPGFGHRLYPAGDPRARLLLRLTRDACTDSPIVTLADGMIETVQRATGQHPNLDFGLVTLAHACAFPTGSALTLFALGRTAGWIAHAIEQSQTGVLIRPRARYTGRMPDNF